MNISITNLCNRRCKYCFQKNWYLSDKATVDSSVREMPLSEYKEILTWASTLDGLKLMGGEPLLHPQIADFIDATCDAGKTCAIITNLSVDTAIIERVIKSQGFSCVKAFLINSDYPQNQRDLFIRNFEYLCKEASPDIAVSTTLLPDTAAIMRAAERIKELSYIYKSIVTTDCPLKVRLSPYCPNPKERFIPFDYSTVLADFLNTVWAYGILPTGFDCTVLDSEINSQATEAYRHGGVTIRKEPCFNRAPFDLLVDGSIIWCSSCNYVKLDSWRDYPNFEAAKTELCKRHVDYYKSHVTEKAEHKINFCLAKEVCNEVSNALPQ